MRCSVYNREKKINIYLGDKKITVVVWMGDLHPKIGLEYGKSGAASDVREDGRRVHEMEVEIDISFPDMVILDVRGKMIQVPRIECKEALPALSNAVGLEIRRGLTVKMEEAIGGMIGCSHMTNLVMEACYCSVQGQYAMSRKIAGDIFDEMTQEERIKAFMTLRPQMINSCVVYSDESKLIKGMKDAPVTEKVERLIRRFAERMS